jgi:hypothetical protein
VVLYPELYQTFSFPRATSRPPWTTMIHGRGGLISRVMLQRDAAGHFLPIPLVDVHNLSNAFLIDGNLCNISEPSDFYAEEDVDSS